jgi:2-polyprenyl-3-methyl-5-hydroxy-6-metoxy-1,4-benzoquinol methylase
MIQNAAAQPATGSDGEDLHYSGGSSPDAWWRAHFHDAADEVIDFFAGDGISFTGRRVADVGCGDGIIDLALALRAEPERLVGFDVRATDVPHLARLAREHAGLTELPTNLSFATCDERTLPAEDHSFDYVVSWSAFEHIADPTAVLGEIRRILTPEGVLFIQLWPFYDSAHGTHLVDWFPDGFAQYRHTDEEIARTLRASDDQVMGAEMLEAYRTLNRITADDLHGALRRAGLRTAKLALRADAVHLPDEVSDLPFSRIGISGIKLFAIPAPEPQPAGIEAADATAHTPPEHRLGKLLRGFTRVNGMVRRNRAPGPGRGAG